MSLEGVLRNSVRVLAGAARYRFAAFFAGVVFIVLCTFYPMIAESANAALIGAGPTVDVAIAGIAFNPQVITITAGTTVRWTNSDFFSHTSSSDVTDTLNVNYWNSPFLSQGAAFSQTFTTPGVYAYHCNVHFTMHGTVVVLSNVYLPMIMNL